MSVPVINTTTSVLGYKQWEAWTYQPYATNSPTSWACPNLPAGLSIDTPVQYAATGVASTDVITATGNTFVNGSQVLLPSLTGGAGLVANTIYFVRDVSGATFKLAATLGGTAINFTTDISAASISLVPSGKISGAASVSGVFVCGLTATNADGTSVPLVLTIGIDAANAALTSSGYEVTIDVATRTVSATAALTSAAATPQGVVAPLLFAKENDDLLLWIKFQKNGQNLDLNIHTLAIAIKEFEPDARLVLGDTFTKFGTGTGAYYGLYAAFTGSALAAALSNYEANAGTAFNAIAEIEWQEANPNNVGGFGPIYLRFTTQDFLLKIASDMAQEV